MDMNNQVNIKLQLLALSEYMQTTLTDAQVKLYARDLESFGPELLCKAIALLKEDPDLFGGRFPLPAKIRAYIEGDRESRANKITEEIMQAIRKHGVYDRQVAFASMSREASLVSHHFGWNALCHTKEDQIMFTMAQIKSYAKTVIQDCAKQIALEDNSNKELEYSEGTELT